MLFCHFRRASWPETVFLFLFIIGFFLLWFYLFLFLFEVRGEFLYFFLHIRLSVKMNDLILSLRRVWSPKRFKLTFNRILIILNQLTFVLDLLVKMLEIICNQILGFVCIISLLFVPVPFKATAFSASEGFFHLMNLVDAIYGVISINYDSSSLFRPDLLILLTPKNRVIHRS